LVTAGPELTNRDRRLKIDEVVRELSRLPGVKSAGAAMKLPLRGGGDNFGITIPGHDDADRPFTNFRIGTLNYFGTMSYRLRSGRLFTSADLTDTTRFPVLINESLAAKYFPGENPVGRVVGGGFNTPQTIIGVVSDAAEAELKTAGEPTRYYLAGSAPWFGQSAAFVIRTTRSEDATRMLDEARRVVQRVAPGFGIQGATTMQRVLDTAIGPVRQVMSLLTLLSTLALVLGAVGIYGVISHFASRRRRDWAIRVALGLSGSGVVRHILTQGLTLALIGVAIGGVIAAVAGRTLASFLYGVHAIDLVSFASAGLLLSLIGVAGAFIPARRAGTVDPALVLREQ
jgi:putative ABC transport system permease protein